MTKLIVHIGLPKTGTTSIQDALSLSRPALLDRGILYPRTVRTNNHRVSQGFLAGTDNAHRIERRLHDYDEERILKESKAAWDLVLEDIENFTGDLIVLSSESFSDVGQTEQLPQLLSHFDAICDDVTYVTYLRSPDRHYLSLYQQRLKNFGPDGPKIAESRAKRRVGQFVELRGKAVRGHKFDRASLIGGDVVTDFIHRYLGENTANVIERPAHDSNPSLSADAMAIFEAFHDGTLFGERYSHFKEIFPFRQELKRIDPLLPGQRRPRFRPGVARAVFDAAQDIDWVQDTFGFSFDRPSVDSATGQIDLGRCSRVRDFCEVDEDRYALLRAHMLAWKTEHDAQQQKKRDVNQQKQKAFKPATAGLGVGSGRQQQVHKQSTKTGFLRSKRLITRLKNVFRLS